MNNNELIEALQTTWYSWGEDANKERQKAANEIIRLNKLVEEKNKEILKLRCHLERTIDLLLYIKEAQNELN